MTLAKLSVLIPAAGASERLGQPKQLLEHAGKPLLANAVDLAATLSPREIIVVTGSGAGAVEQLCHETRALCVHNPEWRAGMGGSIATGAAAVSRESAAVMILLCDQWRLRKQDLQNLAATWRRHPDSIVVSEARGHYTPPVIFPRRFISTLQTLEGRQGARRLLDAYPDSVVPVVMENAFFDLDTRDQLEGLPE